MDFLKSFYPNAPGEDIAAAIKEFKDQDVSKVIEAKIQIELDTEWIKVKPLLVHCGYDLSNSPFFKVW